MGLNDMHAGIWMCSVKGLTAAVSRDEGHALQALLVTALALGGALEARAQAAQQALAAAARLHWRGAAGGSSRRRPPLPRRHLAIGHDGEVAVHGVRRLQPPVLHVKALGDLGWCLSQDWLLLGIMFHCQAAGWERSWQFWYE